MEKLKLLFVCSSNICRSPYCEMMFKRMLIEHPKAAEKVEWVKSGAVFNPSFKIHKKAVVALEREGFDKEYILAHKPAYLWFHYKRFKEADIIVGMTKGNKPFVPLWMLKKFTTISELVDGKYKAVPDPFLYKNIEDYCRVMDVLKDYLTRYIKTLEKE